MSLGLKPKAEAVKPVEVVASLGFFGGVSRKRAFECFVFQNGSMMCHGGSIRVPYRAFGIGGLWGLEASTFCGDGGSRVCQKQRWTGAVDFGQRLGRFLVDCFRLADPQPSRHFISSLFSFLFVG